MAKTKINPNETTAQKLVRLANKRVNKAIISIRLVGNLGGYGPTQQQQEMIIKVITAEVAKMSQNVRSASPVAVDEFKLG